MFNKFRKPMEIQRKTDWTSVGIAIIISLVLTLILSMIVVALDLLLANPRGVAFVVIIFVVIFTWAYNEMRINN